MLAWVKSLLTRERLVSELVSVAFGYVIAHALGVGTSLPPAAVVPAGVVGGLLMAAALIARQDRHAKAAVGPVERDVVATPSVTQTAGLPDVYLWAEPMDQHLVWRDGQRSESGNFWISEPYVEAIGRLKVTNAGSTHPLRLHPLIEVLDLDVRAPEAAHIRPYRSFPDAVAAWSDFELDGNVMPGKTEEFQFSFALNGEVHLVPMGGGRTSEGWSMPSGPTTTRLRVTDQWNRQHVSSPITFSR